MVKITREHAPYTHSLPLLAEKLNIEIPKNIKKRLAKFIDKKICKRILERIDLKRGQGFLKLPAGLTQE